jgi:hypothetical protein
MHDSRTAGWSDSVMWGNEMPVKIYAFVLMKALFRFRPVVI